MPLLQVVVILVLVGLGLWFVQAKIPMDATIKSLLTGVVIVATVLWLLGLFFGWDFGGVWVGRHR